MDPFEDSEPVKFTSILRDKIRQQRNLPTLSIDSASQLKLIAKRNIEIKRDFELSKQGIVVDSCYFEPETTYIKRCRLSKEPALKHLYDQFLEETRRFGRLRLKQDANLARHLKYLNQDEKLAGLPKQLDKDYYQWRQEFDQKTALIRENAKSTARQILLKKSLIQRTECNIEPLVQQGFTFSETTFDSLFVKGWQLQGEETSDEEAKFALTDNVYELDNEEIKNGVSEKESEKVEIEIEEKQKKQEQEFTIVKAEQVLDLSMIEPSKVNWFKYLVDTHLNDESSTILNSTDAYANLLNIVLSVKKNEEIQEELLDLVGFDNFELCMQLLEKRVFIQDYCGQIQTKLAIEKAKDDAYKGKNFDMPRGNIGVSVEFRKKGGSKQGKKTSAQIYEMSKGSNYDLLVALGFDKSLIAENKRLGLKERNMKDLNRYVLEHAQDMKDGNIEMEHSKEVRAQIYASQVATEGSKVRQDENDDWKFVEITPPPKAPIEQKTLIPIKSLPKFCHQAFGSAQNLNQIQSIVYQVAFKQSRSLLVAAPTGAGKTNIALMTILREISLHLDQQTPENRWAVVDKPCKIVYIAPLKALASEIVDKFKSSLSYLGIKVRELTGDMGLTKQEIADTHIIVATPEKWDVVTRKTDGMMSLVNVLIIDEIHLLNDERGLVLECLVARAISTGLKMQKPIRIVGLSATLPNFTDVAEFIQADAQGTFCFDTSYRPTPLKCAFYGIKELGNAQRGNNIMNEIIFENLVRILKMGKQCIIFAHKRAETYSTAMELIDILKQRNKYLSLFDCENSYKAQKQVSSSKNQQVKELFQYGFSTHHAGMLRKDRDLVEDLFHNGHIKVLCSTSTLAWGVNLPAYAVIIKGTKVYDSSAGAYKDIGVFDVQQIFGRAGRPQYDKEGEAIILTPFKQMEEYVKMMQNKQQVESHLDKGLNNCINAEIAAGQISTVAEGVQWLKKSYYYRRFQKLPTHYGIRMKDLEIDPSGHMILLDKVNKSIQELNRARLIRFNQNTEQVYSTDMGRIASNYYINVDTMSYLMANLTSSTSEERVLFHLSQSSEFKQLDARKEEFEEMKQLVGECSIVEVDKTSYNEAHTKVLCLFEAYLKKRQIKTFSLISDMAYVVQNSARLLRAMFEIALQKNFSILVKACLKWCQILDKRLLPSQHIMRQFTLDCSVGKLTNQKDSITKYGYIKDETVYRLEQFNVKMHDLYEKKLDEAGRYIAGVQLDDMYKFLSYIPYLDIDVKYQPITRTILKVQLTINADFNWNDRWNGMGEPFWIIVDDDSEILHQEYFNLQKKDVHKGKSVQGLKNEDFLQLTFFIPYQVPEGYDRIPPGTYYHLDIISDRWYGVEFNQIIELDGLAVPDEDYPNTKLLPLRPISISALNDPKFESIYKQKLQFFNPIQTQVFHTLFHTDNNVLVGAPTGSGKTIMSEFAMLRVFAKTPKKKVIYIAPLKALAKERILDWKVRLGGKELQKKVLELTGDNTPDLVALKNADLLITTPEKWDGISRNWQHRSYVSEVALVVIDEIHLLGQERGPVIEVIISRMRYISEQTGNNVRFVGLSTALANAKDVADWLGIGKQGLFNFKPSVRPVPIKVFFEGFPEKLYCPRMATMNKPTFKAIMTHSKDNPVLVFVSSRRQTRLTALDLIALSAADQQEMLAQDQNGLLDFKKPFLLMDSEEISVISEYIKDENLRHTIQFGVGMHHAGLEESDRKIVEDLFVKKKIQVLVTTSTLAWGVNFPARLVVVKGTEFFDPAKKRYVDFPLTDLLQMIGRAGRPGMDDHGTACIMVQEEKKNFYKKFLYEPFPVESSLANLLVDHLNAEIAAGTLSSRKHCIDYLTWTYFFRRLTKNPAFYNVDITDANGVNEYLKSLVERTLRKLEAADCVELDVDSDTIRPTTLGYLASFYYLSHETVKQLSDSLKTARNVGELIDVLSQAKEFAGLPVRHNEDVLNEALSHLVPLKVPKHKMEDPHVKANLLLQAHFDRCPLPITDFITDSKSVLDQSIRVIQGMIDIASHKESLENVQNLISLLQMLVQGQWLNQSPFLNLPHFDVKKIRNLNQLGIYHLIQLIESNRENVLKQCGLSLSQTKEVSQVLDKVPQVIMKWSMVAVDDCNEPMVGQEIEEGGEAQLVVQLRRVNSAPNQHVAFSNFPKQKECSWFLIVSDPETKKVICMKRVAFKRLTQKSMIVLLPESFNTPLQVDLMCDSYIGLDQVYNIDLFDVNNRIRTDQLRKPQMNKNQQEFSDEEVELNEKGAYNKDYDSEDSFDGFESYNLMRQDEESLKKLEQAQNEQVQNENDGSFEFDIQLEDIYDLTMF